MARRKATKPGSEIPDARGGKYALMPHCLLASEAFRTASFRARSALMVVFAKHNGFNNGRIALSTVQLAEGLDCWNYRANSRAMAELESRGIVVLAKHYPASSRLAREYRLTFVRTADGPPTNDYLSWRMGDPGTKPAHGWKRSRPAATAAETSIFTAASAADLKLSVEAVAAETAWSNEFPPFFPGGADAAPAAHIYCHSTGRNGTAGNGQQARCRPKASPAVAISAAPGSEELRSRVREVISAGGRGSQKIIAELAGLSASGLSKFVNNDGGLSEAKRTILASSLLRAEAVLRQAPAGKLPSAA